MTQSDRSCTIEELQDWLLDQVASLEVRYDHLVGGWVVTIMHPGNRFDGRSPMLMLALAQAIGEAERWDERCRAAGRWLPR